MFRQASLITLGALTFVIPVLIAQEASSSPDIPFASVGVSTWFSVVHIPSIPNAPFSATTEMEGTQSLADGTVVTTKTMTTIARDSLGRTHNENRYFLRPSDNGNGRIRDITIYDPVARTRTTLIPETQVARVSVFPPASPIAPSAAARKLSDREDLGFSTIDGMSVHGFRQTRTIPEGVMGNDHPLSITDEYWYSDELRMNITLKHADPQHGTQIVTLTNLSRSQPDPKMFEVPEGYRVENESAPEAPASNGAVRIGAGVAEANLIQKIDPVYPPLALSARVQGSVNFNASIGKDGSIDNLQLVSGHPLLVNAAKEAVLQWKYRPTLLNGNAVAVIAPVTVTFTLPE